MKCFRVWFDGGFAMLVDATDIDAAKRRARILWRLNTLNEPPKITEVQCLTNE